MKRIIVLILLIAAVAGAGFWYVRHDGERSNELVLSGNVDVRQVNLAFKVAGRIATLAVDEGDPVAAGQVVAALDKRYFDDEVRAARARVEMQAANLARLENGTRPEEVEQARAIVAERRATLENAKLVLDRQQELLARGNTSRQAYDNALSTQRTAEAQLQSGVAALRLAEIGPRPEDITAARALLAAENEALIQAERRRADADLVAPGDGTVLTRVREVGAIVGAGETVFAVTLAAPVWVRAYVAEPELGRIRPGMAATIRTDGGRVYQGQVGFISPLAEFTPKSVETRELRTDLVYRLRIVIDKPDAQLRQGMPVTVVLGQNAG